MWSTLWRITPRLMCVARLWRAGEFEACTPALHARLVWALLTTPRELFLTRDQWDWAYDVEALPTLDEQTTTPVHFVVRMIVEANPGPGARILEVGTGPGYQAALLASMGCDVTTIERHGALSARAQHTLTRLGLGARVRCLHADGTSGAPQHAPFDIILAACAAPHPPLAWLEQLADGGRLLMPQGEPDRMHVLMRITRQGERFAHEALRTTAFVPLQRGVVTAHT